MKVLHAAETIKGGVATVVNSLIEDQIKRKDITNVMCLVPADQEVNLIKIDKLTTYLFERNGRNILCMISFFICFFKIIIREKPDVIHLHSSFAGLLGRLTIFLSGRLHKTKVIYCPHAFSFLMNTSSSKKRIYILAEKFLEFLTDRIICVSQSEYDSAIENKFNTEKLVLIKNGVKVKNIFNNRDLNNKSNYKILFVGRFDYQKGIDILADAISKLKDINPEITYEFNLIGEAVNDAHEITFVESSNIKVNKLGWLTPNELEIQYLNHDAIVIPSRWEGFAMVPLESMSYGLPIISSDIAAFKELEVNHDKHIIFFHDSNDLSKIFSNIKNLTLEENRKMAIEVFSKNFNDDDMKSKTYNCYI